MALPEPRVPRLADTQPGGTVNLYYSEGDARMHWIPPDDGHAEPKPTAVLLHCDQSGTGVNVPEGEPDVTYETEIEGEPVTVVCRRLLHDNGSPVLHTKKRLPIYQPRQGAPGYKA